ncbi:MAG: terminase [Terracidiphilus sp.]
MKSILQDERRETDGVFRALPEKKDETGMKLTKDEWLRGAGRWMGLGVYLLGMAMGSVGNAQGVSTTTVQGTVYLANGQAGTGTLVVSWPAFTTANGQAVAADSATVAIAPDGFVSVNLAPNLGATPAGPYYTAVFYMSDGTTSTQYRVVTAGDRNAGRGLTVQNLHCSELARWPGDPAETLAGLRASMAPGAELILESTPDGVGGCFHEEWQKAGETGMVRHFFPWWMERRYRAKAVDEASLTEEELALMGRHRLDREQIGYRRQIRADFRGLARQEFAEDEESCFLASGDSVFELAAVEARLAAAPEPAERRQNGELEIWLPPVNGKEYLVALDPAGGGSEGDYSAAQVLEMETGLQCAEFAGHVGGLELARLVTTLACEYNQAWLVVERNNHGSGVLALVETVCGYQRVYRQAGQPGWLTTSLSRPAVLGQLGAELVEQPERFQSRKLLGECRSFVRVPDGGTGARAGTHDDRVMAMAIALGARAELLSRGQRSGVRDQGTGIRSQGSEVK